MRKLLFLFVAVLSACSAPGGPYPSLQPRAAEALDPRVPVTRALNNRPVSGVLAARLAALVAGNARLLETIDWRPAYADIDKIVGDALAWERIVADRSWEVSANHRL